MTFLEIAVMAWICDRCGLEAIVGDDDMPAGWAVHPSGEHVCAVCAA